MRPWKPEKTARRRGFNGLFRGSYKSATSKVTISITHINGDLMAPLFATHEPPSRLCLGSFNGSSKGSFEGSCKGQGFL